MEYNLQFDKLCAKLGLGRLTEPPSPLTGGHLHRMYSVQTDQRRYAVKALNPQVMRRPEALPSIIESECVACIAARHIHAAPALIFNGSAVQELDGQYYLIFDWLGGTTLTYGDIEASHCARMGSALAALHKIDFVGLCSNESTYAEESAVDWRAYLQLGLESGAVWTDLMRAHINQLEDWSAQLAESSSILPAITVVSHCDLEPKNVLWLDGAPVIIDWEAAGRIHPAHDMVETALYWSKDASGGVDQVKFNAFVRAYKSVNGQLYADWPVVLKKGFSSLSGWLEYSLKRSLAIDCCDEAEQQMGSAHVLSTINAAARYFETIPLLHHWLGSL